MADQRRLPKTPWPRAVRDAIAEGHREGYLRAMEDVYACILAGDLIPTLIKLRREQGHDDVEPLCLTIEQRVALGWR